MPHLATPYFAKWCIHSTFNNHPPRSGTPSQEKSMYYVDICRHIKTNGLQCKGVALTGSTLCYFHNRLHRCHAPYRFTAATQGYLLPGQHIQLGPLEDRESVQVAISQVVNALATGHLDVKHAMALLYGLQLASSNAAPGRLHLEPHPPKAMRE